MLIRPRRHTCWLSTGFSSRPITWPVHQAYRLHILSATAITHLTINQGCIGIFQLKSFGQKAVTSWSLVCLFNMKEISCGKMRSSTLNQDDKIFMKTLGKPLMALAGWDLGYGSWDASLGDCWNRQLSTSSPHPDCYKSEHSSFYFNKTCPEKSTNTMKWNPITRATVLAERECQISYPAAASRAENGWSTRLHSAAQATAHAIAVSFPSEEKCQPRKVLLVTSTAQIIHFCRSRDPSISFLFLFQRTLKSFYSRFRLRMLRLIPIAKV